MAGTKSISISENPLVDGVVAGTINKCRCALTWMSQVNEPESSDDLEYGRHLLMLTIVQALRHAEAQLDAKPRLEVANG